MYLYRKRLFNTLRTVSFSSPLCEKELFAMRGRFMLRYISSRCFQRIPLFAKLLPSDITKFELLLSSVIKLVMNGNFKLNEGAQFRRDFLCKFHENLHREAMMKASLWRLNERLVLLYSLQRVNSWDFYRICNGDSSNNFYFLFESFLLVAFFPDSIIELQVKHERAGKRIKSNYSSLLFPNHKNFRS